MKIDILKGTEVKFGGKIAKVILKRPNTAVVRTPSNQTFVAPLTCLRVYVPKTEYGDPDEL